MFILITPETVRAMEESWDDFTSWLESHSLFLGCSGLVLWIYLLTKGIIWPFVHVRFV